MNRLPTDYDGLIGAANLRDDENGMPAVKRQRRARRLGVLGLGTAVAAASLITAGARSHPKAPEKTASQQLLTGEQLLKSQESLITGANKLLNSVVILRDGAITRPTASFNSDVSIVGEGNLQDKEVVLNQPSLLEDKDGEWLIGTFDSNDGDTLSEKASKLIVVSVGENALHSSDPAHSIQIYPTTAGDKAVKVIPVDYMDLGDGHGAFENSANDQLIAGAMTATAMPAGTN